MPDNNQFATWEGWAHVEMMGHQSITGYVRTLYFGNIAMLNVRQPAIDRLVTLERNQSRTKPIDLATNHLSLHRLPAGTKIREHRAEAETLVAVSALYRLTPIAEAQALAQIPTEWECIEFPPEVPQLEPAPTLQFPRCVNCNEPHDEAHPVGQTYGYCNDCVSAADDEDDDAREF